MLVQLCRWVIFLLACSCTGASIAAQEWTYPPQLTLEDVRQRIDGVEANHPRLLVGPGELAELRESLRDRPLARALADQIVRQAESLLDQPPVERRLEGRRLLGQSRLAVQRVLTLAMAFHLSGRSEFAARAEKEMLAAPRFPTGTRPLPRRRGDDVRPGHRLRLALPRTSLGQPRRHPPRPS